MVKCNGYKIAAMKKRKKEEDRIRRGIVAMNGTCAQNNAPKASRNKRNRLKKKHESIGEAGLRKKKNEDNNDNDDDDLQLALDDISKQTGQVALSSSLQIAPPCVIKRKLTNKKKTTSCNNRRQVSLPLETLRSATLKLQYPLQANILKVGQPRLITTSIDIIRCLLAESNWALMRRKNPTESFKLWFSTHDTLSSFLNSGDYESANQVLVQLNKVSIGYGLRENNYFELLGDACNSLFGISLLHNKIFDPDLISVNQQRLTGDKNTKTKTVLKRVYLPIWAKISETLNMITSTLIGGKGDMFALQKCADNVLNKSKNDRLNKIIKDVTARTTQMAKFGVAVKPKQKQQPLLYPYPPPMFYTNGGLIGFNNDKATQAAFAGLPQFTPTASSTTAPTQPNLQTQNNIVTTSASSPATTTGLHFSAPVLFPSYPEETTTPPRSYPPVPEALQRNLLQQTTPVSDHEEEGGSVTMSDEEAETGFIYDEMWNPDSANSTENRNI